MNSLAARLADLLADRSTVRRMARRILPRQVRHHAGTWIGDRILVPRSADRIFLERALLPAVSRRGGTILLVGCRYYTADYPRQIEHHGARCWTIDIDPGASRWGAPERHIVDTVENIASHFQPRSLDTVVLNGVFGFGLNAVPAQNAALAGLSTVMKPGGCLLLGWNVDRVRDVPSLTELRRRFRPMHMDGLFSRHDFPDNTHIFAFYESVPD